MKKRIRVKSTGISIVTSVVAGLGIFGWFNSLGENFRLLSAILFFSSAATGLVVNYKSWTDEQDVNDKVRQLIEKYDRELQDVNNQLVIQVENNRETTASAKVLSEKLDLKIDELQLLGVDYSSLVKSLAVARHQIELKDKELITNQQATDTRFQDFLKEFIAKLVAYLYDYIERAYTLQDERTVELLRREEYENIHPELTKYYEDLATEHHHHINLVSNLTDYDTSAIHTVIDASKSATEVMEYYHQIIDEITALKIRFRNLKNLDERRALDEYLECEQYKTTKAKAIESVREQASFDKSVLDRLEAQVNENSKAITEDYKQLLAAFEKANEKVAELSQPIMWKFALNHATKAGNIIIQYAQSLRIHLDRSHYTGDVYSADLYFFTDRINAAQTIDIKALNEEGEKIAQIANLREPVQFTYDYDSRLVVAHIVMQYRESEKKVDPVTKVKQFLKPPEAIIPFIRDSYHVGLWAATGGGKTTAIANIIGGMIQELSETGTPPTIRLTIPKIDADTQKIFPDIHWLGIPESVFGLLEAALEIQYRIHKSERAFKAKELIQDYDPILFFIDEINLIFTRWGTINDADLEDVLNRFEATLKDERLNYFRETMRIELTNYKNQFAKKLLLFIWQTGRSLRVKSLIAGQNLQPGNFGLKVNDLANCSYLAMGASIKSCSKYKVRESDIDLITKQYDLIQQAIETESNLKYTALHCPSVGKSYFGILPPPNYYQWSANLLTPQSPPVTPHATTEEKSKMAETFVEQNGRRAAPEILIQNDPHSTLEARHTNNPSLFNARALLAEKYQNLDFRGYADLLASLPKKADGTVNKKLSYEQVFKVWKADLRKVYSAFIDWLEANFK